MKIRLLLALAGLAIGLRLPALAQEKEEANPFPFRAILATPQIAQQLDVINRQLDEAVNKHDAVAAAALHTEKATIVTPLGTFSGRDGIEKYFTDVFQRYNPSDQLIKISYVYAFGDDLCAIGGWTVTIHGGSHRGGGYLVNVYTRVRDTWKIRAGVTKY